VNSLGGNIVEYGCPWLTAQDHQLSAPPIADGLADNGGLVPTARLESWETYAIGVGIAKYCEATDARGRVRPAGACDSGSYELGAESIASGGMNGLWFDAAADGHYVTIQRVHDDDTALVVWNTFDRSGNQAWIYGVGHVVGRHIHVEMSQNVGGHLQSGGAPTGSVARAWGTVDIDLTNCLDATMTYRSSLPGFGNGQFPLDRLAYISDFGCVD
jgi:hypothetical protein